jgi:hypothetical protein
MSARPSVFPLVHIALTTAITPGVTLLVLVALVAGHAAHGVTVGW